ncbi:MAG: PEP-CTERM sorting domain-containing protein [Planctomycetota bacterium]
MTSRLQSRNFLAATIGAGLLGLAGPASAGTITFDPIDGYFLGTSLVNGPGFAGNGSLYSITSLGGGNGAAQSSAVPQSAFANNRFTPDAAFLGTPNTLTAGNVYSFSFDLRPDAAATNDDFGLAHRIRIGGTDSTPIIDFQIFDNGRFQYWNGTGYSNALNVNAVNFDLDDAAGRFIPVEGTIDFNTGTYDLSFDGVAQASGLTLLSTPTDFGQVTFQWGPSGSTPDYRQISIDNLSLGLFTATPLDGDANGDGSVDLLDFDILAGNFGTAVVGGAADGDFNGDGAVDLLDFDILAGNFGATSPSAVPEPASLALLGVGGAALLRRRR